MSEFRQALDAHFPGAVTADDFLELVRTTLRPLGFTPDRTLPLVSVCRDELTSDLTDAIDADWGPAFTLAGLGGLPALGRTGWGAALSHVPAAGRRGAVLVMGFPHIGIEDDGRVGVTVRPGQTEATATCGALVSVLERSRAGTLPDRVEVDDYEATTLALRLVDPGHLPSSLTELTVAALDAIEADLWTALAEFEVWRAHDVAVWCGVQIHGHGGRDWIWARDAVQCGPDGERRSLLG